MSKSKYTVRELLIDEGIKQIIIPEIQRDYVWKRTNVERLLKSIVEDVKSDLSKKEEMTPEILNSLPPSYREVIERQMEDDKVYSNIGFVYAYEDAEFKDRSFLIDGQQRLTTIYLLLLAVCIKTHQQDHFRTHYFIDSMPKVDYKVRESAHTFLQMFIEFMLSGEGDIKDQCHYYSSYDNDVTIQTLMTNYEIIENYIADKDINVEYVEDNIELWFFDINKSKQGEQLYIYMNSRGEEVKANENIKANLLEGCSDSDKNKWGREWEKWQDFFWKQRGKNANADNGFNEFLRWVIIINYIKDNRSSSVESLVPFIREIRNNTKFESDLLTLDKISETFIHLVDLFENTSLVKEEWLSQQPPMSVYYQLLPVLVYKVKYGDAKSLNLERIHRFFLNTIRLTDVAKNPDNQLVNAIRLIEDLCGKGKQDPVGFIDIVETVSSSPYKTILTKEELYKLNVYREATNNDDRANKERVIRQAEDNHYLSGEISFLLYLSNIELDDTSMFNENEFEKTLLMFEELFDSPSDLVIRALLSKGNYSVYDGYATSLGGERFSFDIKDKWKEILKENKNHKYILALVWDCLNRRDVKVMELKDILNSIIIDYTNNPEMNELWQYKIVANPKILSYASKKKVAYNYQSKETFVLLKTKATTFKEMKKFEEMDTF